MTFRIVCSECETPLYSGYDLKSARDILKITGGKCGKCGACLSPHDFTIEVESSFA
ncbi:MAG: hypothetical protein ACE5KU_05985 [Nitrososphaerales archaeon]